MISLTGRDGTALEWSFREEGFPMLAFPLLTSAYSQALDRIRDERERRLRRTNGHDPIARIPDDEDDEEEEEDDDFENEPTRPLRLDRLHL